jgi:hypothetical protein
MVIFHHSCGNRHCPKCQSFEAENWLIRTERKRLDLPHFLVTFTLPSSLRKLVYNNQKKLYDLLFHASSESLKELGANPRRLGGELGMIGVLHTHSRRLNFHPHIHYVVPAGALNLKKNIWISAPENYLLNVQALSRLFRGKFLAGLKELGLRFPADVYKHDWVVHSKPAAKGKQVFQYLSRYLYKGVILEKNILKEENGKITFSYTDAETGQKKTRTLPVYYFLRLILRHVLPKGYRRVRDFGFLHGNSKKKFLKIQVMLLPKVSMLPDMSELLKEKPKMSCRECQGPMKVKVFPQKVEMFPFDPRNRGSP